MSARVRVSVCVVAIVVVAVTIAVAACGGEAPAPVSSPTATTGETPTVEPTSESPSVSPTASDGAALVQERCTECHTLARVEAKSESLAEWTMIVDQMIANGANLNGQERQAVIDYLAATYPDE